MQSVLLHAKSSPSHWRSIGFSSHFCGLSRGQGWRVCSGSGQNVDLTSHFLTQLQCATSVICNMTLKIWALFNACHPSALFVLHKLNVQQQLSPSHHVFLFCYLMFCHQCHQIPAFSTLSLHLHTGWKATLPPAGPRTPGLSANLSTPAYPPPFQPLPPSLTFALTLGSHDLYIKTILKKLIVCIKAASWAHLSVFSLSQKLSTL